jgi:RNA polymerase sigma-70 factor (ECF subfamily)
MNASPSSYTDNDSVLLELIKLSDTKAFEILYERYADALYQFVQRRISEKEDSKEIVQNVLEWLWTNRQSLMISGEVGSYLFGVAKHQTLNYIRSKKIKDRYINHFTNFVSERYRYTTEEMVNLSELESAIEKSISELPEKCQTVFRLNRVEHLSIQNIAERMNISKRTVENYITQALKHLRSNVGEIAAILILMKQ